MEVLDPQGPFLRQWNKIFMVSCSIAVSLDPLFCYIPVIDRNKKCLDSDEKLAITACVLRSLTDIFYLLNIIIQFRIGFIGQASRVFGRDVLIEDPYAIAKRYLLSYFIIDILAVLPVPQVIVLIIIPSLNGEVSPITKVLLRLLIFAQYIPKVIRIYPIFKQVKRTSGIFTETEWAGAAFNLFLYMLASHVVGSLWYLFTIEREYMCWQLACHRHSCNFNALLCGEDRRGDYSYLIASCPLLEPNEIKNSTDYFDFGIFLDALQSHVVETRNFPQKFFYCFLWGLRNLSSLGQNLKTSTFVGEVLFSIFVSILGLVLFSLLIGNMQKYLQSFTIRVVEEMRIKRQQAEQWMSRHMLPENLKERIRKHEKHEWQETRGLEEESLIRNLPKDLRMDINRHLCLSLLKRVPLFENLEEPLLDAICNRLKPVLYRENSNIIHEGDPVDEMLFVMRGDLLSTTTNGGRSRTSFSNSIPLKAGDFCGDALLTWAMIPDSSSWLPISTRTVIAITGVEAFALKAYDLKVVASQFLLHSKQFKDNYRFYSLEWRTWATRCIQTAWRIHCRRKLEKSLREKEDRQQVAMAEESQTLLEIIILN